jgi:PIN domain nuclease of toxin-antitoxin system
MRLLLDTHIFLWFITGDARLSSVPESAITDGKNEVFVSVVSLWETIIKCKLGKLSLPQPPEVYFPEQRKLHQIDVLSLDEADVSELALLPPLHRDPFDRMLISQTIARGMKIVTSDSQILQYPVPRL